MISDKEVKEIDFALSLSGEGVSVAVWKVGEAISLQVGENEPVNFEAKVDDIIAYLIGGFVAEPPNSQEVYSHGGCIFAYCPTPEICRANERGCINAT